MVAVVAAQGPGAASRICAHERGLQNMPDLCALHMQMYMKMNVIIGPTHEVRCSRHHDIIAAHRVGAGCQEVQVGVERACHVMHTSLGQAATPATSTEPGRGLLRSIWTCGEARA